MSKWKAIIAWDIVSNIASQLMVSIYRHVYGRLNIIICDRKVIALSLILIYRFRVRFNSSFPEHPPYPISPTHTKDALSLPFFPLHSLSLSHFVFSSSFSFSLSLPFFLFILFLSLSLSLFSLSLSLFLILSLPFSP